MLVKELKNMHDQDQSREKRLNNVAQQISALNKERVMKGIWTKEEVARREELHYEYLSLRAKINAAEENNAETLRMLNQESYC